MASPWSTPAPAEPLPLLSSSRRHLVLSLPRWATDCLRRAEPAIGPRPLVLWERQRGAMRIAALDDRAAARGLSPGDSLSDARAQVPDLEAREIDHAGLAHLFGEFADWHSNASPLVAILTDHAPYGDLCLDITGVTHLFGGEAAMLETLLERLRVRGFTVEGAIAGTIGAAWALAHYDPGRVVSGGESLAAALAPLPVSGLRLDEAGIVGLRQMGLKTIGQLAGRDRKALAARFGADLVRRLDQALGGIEERLTPRLPLVEHLAERRFAEPIGLLDDVLVCAEDLAVRLTHGLEAESLGAQSFHLFLYLTDHRVIRMSVNASRPTRDAGHVARLFRHRAERLADEYDPGFGIDMIRLGASSLSPLDSTQLGAFGSDDGSADLARLFDRMASRLGPLAVLRAVPVDTHIPERATRFAPVVAASPDVVPSWPAGPPRPLRLLPHPEPIAVVAEVPDGPPSGMIWRRIRYRFARGSGPERIEAEWWRSGRRLVLRPEPPDDPVAAEPSSAAQPGDAPQPPALEVFEPEAALRDYYVVEDEAGRRFWLFRQGLYAGGRTPHWFLHGIFA